MSCFRCPEMLHRMRFSRFPKVPQRLRCFRGAQPLARLELGDVITFPEVDQVSPHQFPTAGNHRL